MSRLDIWIRDFFGLIGPYDNYIALGIAFIFCFAGFLFMTRARTNKIKKSKKKKSKTPNLKGKYLIQVIDMRPGINKHKIIRNDDLEIEFSQKIEGKENKIQIKPNRLYEIQRNILKRFYDIWINGISNRYYCLIRESGEIVEPETAKISSHVLFKAKEWKGVDKFIKGEFKEPLSFPIWIIIALGVVIAGVVVYMFMTGRVKL